MSARLTTSFGWAHSGCNQKKKGTHREHHLSGVHSRARH
nr:MAG TPA: hypothetical protein [Caudoviricetes sp.]